MLDASLGPITEEVGNLRTDMNKSFREVNRRLGNLENSVGTINEARLRQEAATFLGEKSVKSCTVQSIYDLVNLLSLSPEQPLVNDQHEDRQLRSAELIAEAELHLLLTPTMKAFLDHLLTLPFDIVKNQSKLKDLKTAIGEAKASFDENDEDSQFHSMVKLIKPLREVAQSRVAQVLIHFKNGFTKVNKKYAIDPQRLLTATGPGLMLFELSSRGLGPSSVTCRKACC